MSEPSNFGAGLRGNPLLQYNGRGSQRRPLLGVPGHRSGVHNDSRPHAQTVATTSDRLGSSSRPGFGSALLSSGLKSSGGALRTQSFPGMASTQPSTNNINLSRSGSFNNVSDSGASGTSFAPSNSSSDEKFVRVADYKICSVGKESRQNIRRHIIRFHGQRNKPVDPSGSDFTPPVKIQRRDMLKYALEANKDGGNADGNVDNRQQQQQHRADSSEPRQTFDATKVAPHGGALNARRTGFRQKTRQVFHDDPEEVKLRQEEKNPWVIEDFDAHQQWVGHLEGGQNSTYMVFIFTVDGFKAVRCDRFYRFVQRNSYQTLSIDEAEERMNSRSDVSRWFMKSHQKEDGGPPIKSEATKPRMRTGMEWSARTKIKGRESDDELDYMEDFADDEETPYIEDNDEDNKELETRIKKEMLQANALGDDAEDVDETDEFGKREVSKNGKKLQRYLMKLEKNQAYESSDESDNPYMSSDEETDSDEEYLRKMADGKREEESKKQSSSGTPSASQEALSARSSSASQKMSRSTPAASARNSPSPQPSTMAESLTNKEHYALVKASRPMLVTLRISTSRLAQFSSYSPQDRPTAPADIVSASKRNRDPEADMEPQKKIRLRITDHSRLKSSDDENLIQESEVLRLIQRQRFTTIELLRQFNEKFKKDKRNKEQITTILRKVARMENGFLVPRE